LKRDDGLKFTFIVLALTMSSDEDYFHIDSAVYLKVKAIR